MAHRIRDLHSREHRVSVLNALRVRQLGMLTPVLIAAVMLAGCGSGSGDESTESESGGAAASGGADNTGAASGDGGGSGGSAAPDGAIVKGKVTMTGEVPAQKKIDLAGVPQCAQQHEDPIYPDKILAGADGGLKNVLVYVDGPWEMDPPDEAAMIDQVDCRYVPHVMAIQVDQKIEIKNSDKFPHNVHYIPRNNEEDNIGMPRPDTKVRSFPNADKNPIMFKCEMHPWMKAWVAVIPHPYFSVTDEHGNFSIQGVPDGEWDVVFWHESKGRQTRKVKFTTGEESEVNDLVYDFSG